MSALTPADSRYIIQKAQLIRHFTHLSVQIGSPMHKERADKEMALLETFVSGIGFVKEGV